MSIKPITPITPITPIKAIRGMGEVLPENSWHWQYVQSSLSAILSHYGYQEIRLPLLERTELFKRGIGEATDIIEKEMYSFEDKGGESISLRPEGTAGCVRAALEYGLLHHQTQKLFYIGPMFRYERPQKGRLRQFHQMGAEAFGFEGPEVDAEMLSMISRFWQTMGISDVIELQINTLGTPEERGIYRAALVDYFKAHENLLDEDSKRRLLTNPLRILDSKNPDLAGVIAKAPTMMDFLGEASLRYFENLKRMLDQLDIAYKVVPTLVRGLDYYTHLVFEWVTTALGSQGTVCAGGRYDRLIQEFGGQPTPAVGFGLGLERLILLLEEKGKFQQKISPDIPHIYGIVLSQEIFPHALALIEKLRSAQPHLKICLNCSGGSAKSQFRKADKSGAAMAFVLGEEEIQASEVVIKFLRDQDAPQVKIRQENLEAWLIENLKIQS
jgi:histidyl-tRNA synthetase